MSKHDRGIALIVDDNKTNRIILEALLIKNGFAVILAENGRQAVELFKNNKIDIIFMDVMMPVMDGYQATKVIKSICEENNIFIPVIFLTALNDESSLSKCIEVGGDDFISKPYNITILKSKIIAMERVRDLWRKLNAMYARLQSDEEVAEKVFSSAVLAENIQNAEIRSIVKSADIFSGDMFVTAYTPSRDMNILLGDFTGHGLASALGAMPASEVFRAMTAKGYSLSDILKTINKKLSNLLPTNMFMACEAVSIDSSLKHVTICNCGMPPVFVLSDNNISSIESTCLPLGIDVKQEYIEHLQFVDTDINDRIIMLSDGVVDARNGNNEEFGEKRFVEIINQAPVDDNFVIDEVFEHLERYIADIQQSDDVSMAEIRLRPDLLPSWNIATLPKEKATDIELKPFILEESGCTKLSIHTCGYNIKRIDPIPQIINNIEQIIMTNKHSQSLFTILTELYVNAIDHGVLELDSRMKQTADGFSQYFKNREQKLNLLTDEYIKIDIKIKEYNEKYLVFVRIEDSGKGFDVDALSLNDEHDRTMAFGRGITLVKNLCDSLRYELPGNIVDAIYVCHRDFQ